MESLQERIEDRLRRGRENAEEAGYTEEEDIKRVTPDTVVAATTLNDTKAAQKADKNAADSGWKSNA